MITKRQEKLLNYLVKQYIDTAEPVSSFDLKKIARLQESAATVRNDLQELTKQGYIEQPHTSAGRVPTKKAYKYFAEKCEQEKERQFEEFIVPACRQAGDRLPKIIAMRIEIVHHEVEQEMENMQKIMQALENDNLFEILNILETWHKKTMN